MISIIADAVYEKQSPENYFREYLSALLSMIPEKENGCVARRATFSRMAGCSLRVLIYKV